jgi:S1/P1 Nuclease
VHKHLNMKKAILYLLFCLTTIQGFSWGPTGHRVTGWIAEQYLTPRAKAKLKLLLGQESLAIAATWMDEIRSDSTYNYTTDWHFVTIPTGMKYEASTKNPHGDVIMTIERLIQEIKSHTLTPQQETEHIKMLIHLIGDIHQPLHVGFGDDQGGNKVKLKWFRNDSNLHRVWDSDMIDDTKLSYTELAQSLVRPDKTAVKNLQTTTVRDWAYESMSYRDQVYAIGDGNLSYKFGYRNLPLVRQRLVEAGIRIAGVLNALYA